MNTKIRVRFDRQTTLKRPIQNNYSELTHEIWIEERFNYLLLPTTIGIFIKGLVSENKELENLQQTQLLHKTKAAILEILSLASMPKYTNLSFKHNDTLIEPWKVLPRHVGSKSEAFIKWGSHFTCKNLSKSNIDVKLTKSRGVNS